MRALMTWLLLQADPNYLRGGHSEPLEFLALVGTALITQILLMHHLLKN